MFAYWFGNYIVDVLSATPAAILVLIIIEAFNTDSFSGSFAVTRALVLSIFGFIWNAMPFTYLFSFLFRHPSTAQRWIAMLFIGLGLFFHIMFDIVVIANEKFWYFMFSLWPPFLLFQCIFSIAGISDDQSYLEFDVLGKPLTYMLYEGIGWFVLLIIVEYLSHSPKILMKLGLIPNAGKRTDIELDEDVVREQRRISAMLENNDNSGKDTVMIAGLRKVYQQGSVFSDGVKNVAVKDLWFGVPQGEVFGFLGVNGAGKTSALAMLTGERFPSQGIAYVNNYPITNQTMVRRFLGYCPQVRCFLCLCLVCVCFVM